MSAIGVGSTKYVGTEIVYAKILTIQIEYKYSRSKMRPLPLEEKLMTVALGSTLCQNKGVVPEFLDK